MSSDERRRYFRINETVGLSIQLLAADGSADKSTGFAPNAVQLIAKNDEKIGRLLSDLVEHNPTVAELISLLNDKIDDISSALAIESNLLDRIAHRAQEVNLSACGLAFSHDDPIAEGSRIRLELTLFPEETKVRSDGVVVSCELMADEEKHYYCRVNFLGMSPSDQEELIQFVVQSQSAQLKARQNSFN